MTRREEMVRVCFRRRGLGKKALSLKNVNILQTTTPPYLSRFYLFRIYLGTI